MASKTIQINDTDFTSFFTSAGCEVGYKKETGQNEGLMLDGSFTEDTIAVKAVVTVYTMPLTEGQQSSLLQSLYSDDYATVYYFDPRKNAYRSAVMRYEVTKVKHRGNGSDGNEYWTGLSITFEDRFNME